MGMIGNFPAIGIVGTGNIQNTSVTPAKLSTGAPTWDASGNVGIGTSSPSYRLHLNSTGSAVNYVQTTSSGSGNTASWRLRAATYEFGAYVPDNANALVFYDYGQSTERMRIDSSGNLLLGGTSNFLGARFISENASGNQIGLRYSGVATYYQSIDSSGNFTIAKDGTERMRIDSAGNVGIGTSSPASKLTIDNSNLTVSAGYGVAFSGDQTRIITPEDNVFGALIKWSGAGGCRFFGGTNERMRIDSSGNVGIGTGSPGARLDVAGTVRTANGYYINGNTGGGFLWVQDNYPLKFGTNDTERMRIDSSGNLLVGTTGTAGSVGSGIAIRPTIGGSVGNIDIGHGSAAGTGNSYVQFYWNGGVIGTITQSGTTAVAYNTSSDYRLKEQVVPMTGALAKNELLNPVTYKWKTDGSDGQGFIAHELQTIFPDAVTGEKDAVDDNGNPIYQGVDTSFLVGHLVACIKEMKQIIDAQEARIAALEAA